MSPENAMMLESFPQLNALPDLSALEALGYTLIAVQALDVLYTNPYLAHADHSLSELANKGVFDVILSGPDCVPVPTLLIREPVGPVVRKGLLSAAGKPHASQRGIVAVLKDGTVIMDRAQGSTLNELQYRFGQLGNPMVAALGGGGLLIENGRKVTEKDLMFTQMFLGASAGFRAASMQEGMHNIMGIRQGRAYAAWCTRKSGRDIQADFYRFGFGSVIKFAYGSGVFFDDCKKRINGQNPSGFAVKCAH